MAEKKPYDASKADQQHVASLEKQAERAEDKAESAQQKAEDLAAQADVASAAADDAGGAGTKHCPDCGGRLTTYPEPNDNPHKQGQAFCPKCHERKPLRS